MSPPKLPWNAPVSNSIHPKVPCFFKLLRDNLQFSISNGICRSLCHAAAVYVPLGSDHWFQNISRTRAKTQSHLVWFFSLEKSLYLENQTEILEKKWSNKKKVFFWKHFYCWGYLDLLRKIQDFLPNPIILGRPFPLLRLYFKMQRDVYSKPFFPRTQATEWPNLKPCQPSFILERPRYSNCY